MVRVGLIARGEDRGLGTLTREWARNMRPDRTLLLVPDHDLTVHYEWFPGATVSRLDDQRRVVDTAAVQAFIAAVDVIYSAETFYDWRICDWARAAGRRTVCHVMPEYWLHGRHDLPAPDVWWAPTRWRLDQLPAGTRVVPVPIPLDRFTNPHYSAVRTTEPIRWLHVAGASAAADRNGTTAFLGALAYLRGPHDVTLRLQEPRVLKPRVGPRTTFRTEGPTGEYWELYGGHDGLVSPRRYGGLSLPALEAMGAGLALVMTDTEPQRSEWPIVPLPRGREGFLQTIAGAIPLETIDPRQIARTLDRLAGDPAELTHARSEARRYAEAHSWAALEPAIRRELERVR